MIKISARNKIGIPMLLDTIDRLIKGNIPCNAYKMTYDEETEMKIEQLIPFVQNITGDQLLARWLSLRLIDGDKSLLKEIEQRLAKKDAI